MVWILIVDHIAYQHVVPNVFLEGVRNLRGEFLSLGVNLVFTPSTWSSNLLGERASAFSVGPF